MVHIHQGGTLQTYCSQPLRLDAVETNVSWEQAHLSTCPTCSAVFGRAA
jgi:hypothetical protein